LRWQAATGHALQHSDKLARAERAARAFCGAQRGEGRAVGIAVDEVAKAADTIEQIRSTRSVISCGRAKAKIENLLLKQTAPLKLHRRRSRYVTGTSA
jgi:hypothetical protein